jgi:hypothetical protein
MDPHARERKLARWESACWTSPLPDAGSWRTNIETGNLDSSTLELDLRWWVGSLDTNASDKLHSTRRIVTETSTSQI